MEYTKGKWVVFNWPKNEFYSYTIAGDDGHINVASIPQGWANAKANAQLIASAPDLYEALEAFLNVRTGRFEQGKKALAKAEGNNEYEALKKLGDIVPLIPQEKGE